MKKIFLALISVFSLVTIADAQKKTSGAIQFETTIDPAAMAAASGMQIPDQMKARMPSSSKSNFELLFTATNASYMPVEDVEDSNGAGGGGGGMGRMMMRFGGGGGNREYYYSFADQKLTEVFDLNDTTYYMPSKLSLSTSGPMGSFRMGGGNAGDTAKNKQVAPPKIEIIKTDATKKIIGFDCKEVIVKSTRSVKILDMDKDVTEETHIWYTNDLGFNFSPNPKMWTEGTVLAIEGRGSSTIAKSIEYRGVSAKDVTPPKKAKLITEDEYKVKMDAMMKRFRQNRPGGGVQRIVVPGN
ncbi:hypothetical protein EV200_10452 [Pedobacter psychrotolerans]|uniref:GLPGLI family protein n=1 Tax=Pedobacter psychrotolerans TaxID=1843235 RepID=A0A4R2HBW3_9SPHI|nr:hypothetical protein [Pedobacter psychrotolerans]TCO25017.1 hypothetical protein EV200_10452 [Pedobacter psychrotolerans]GGE48763.1 hypothetical protein GCM10011413_13560 [Pedobacter psychrotolerans]